MRNRIEGGNSQGGFSNRENRNTLIAMAPGVTIAALGVIDCIINGRITEVGIGLMFPGMLFTVVGYSVAEAADIDIEARAIARDLRALKEAEEIFRRNNPEAYRLLHPVSDQTRDEAEHNHDQQS